MLAPLSPLMAAIIVPVVAWRELAQRRDRNAWRRSEEEFTRRLAASVKTA
jgi:hypothetical protein